MKSRLLSPVLLMAMLCPAFLLNGQHAFDQKKKSVSYHDVSSLQAKEIRGSSGGNTLASPLPLQTANLFVVNKPVQPAPAVDRQEFIVFSKESGLPVFIRSKPSANPVLKSTSQNTALTAYSYLEELEPLLGTCSSRESFKISRIAEDSDGSAHVRFNQVYKGIEIYGADVAVHIGTAGQGNIFNGRYRKVEEGIAVNPVITKQEALTKAEGHVRTMHKSMETISEDILPVTLLTPGFSLVIYRPRNPYAGNMLAWHLTLFTADHHRWEYFVDAINGNILGFFENTCHADGARTANANDLNGVTRTINTYQAGSNYYLLDASREMFNAAASQLPDEPVGAIITIDMANTWGENQSFRYILSASNAWNNPVAVSAHYNAGVAYEYYRQKHGRNSIDGNGGTIWSVVNVPDVETGAPLDNAFWNGRFMYYGNGDVAFKPLAGALDVAGHEMTHGVVENTANLIYEGEPGAINESMADIFGSMMDTEDWLIGEDVVKTAVYSSGALRSMSDPHNGGSSLSDNGYQPKHMDEKYTGTGDNYGVHINSGIPNHAFYLLATAVGKDKAADIYYRALDRYLTKSSQFIDLRLAVIQSATDIYGISSAEATQAAVAFDAVGITDGQATGNNPVLPENPGNEYVLVYNTDIADLNTLYRSTLDKSDIDPLTTTGFISRPSVTDDGSMAVFVAADNTVHAIITSPGELPDEFVLQNQPIWSNVVISKDGNRLAAVTSDIDTSVYVYDFISEQWAKFYLYTPTYTQGINSAGPVFADALEFDYSGEYLVFDVFNMFENLEGDNIEYWDVNFIRVWDNISGDFGDGTIFKLFTSIPEGVSIGNPAFSKKSPNILAFDYLSSDPEEYYILGCNIETGDVDIIAENNTIGWPTFNKDDSRVAFSTININDDPQIDYVFLNEDKISSNGSREGLFSFAKWPVYFSDGERIISSVKKPSATKPGLKSYPNPFSEFIYIEVPSGYSGNGLLEVIDFTGRKVYSKELYLHENQQQPVLPGNLKPGYYLLRWTGKSGTLTGEIIKAE
ncbi:MAG: M4 family metallopeptidase [Bacteroidales bacterium]|nr:M4 family metallopeptidase [Bacteroidales bacterium]